MKHHLLCALLLAAGCGDLKGFNDEATPLATIHVEATGDFDMVRTPGATGENLRVGLIWGTGWLPEPLCFFPPDTPELAATVAAGCRNPLSFTPDRVAISEPFTPGVPVDLALPTLPAADLLYGDVTARVAYGTLVVYDDRDDSGTLELARARRLPTRGFDDEEDQMTNDIVYGASFVAMTEPDQRLAFREGAFIETGFYPRHGCEAPLPAFSILGAGGFSLLDAAVATMAGVLPSEPAGSCTAAKPEQTLVSIPLRKTEEIREVGCTQRRLDSTVRYREPPVDRPPLDEIAWACTGIPQLGGDDTSTAGIVQLVAATRPEDTCKGLTHYTLFGCDQGGFTCDSPEWDYRTNPPDWWPCPVQAGP